MSEGSNNILTGLKTFQLDVVKKNYLLLQEVFEEGKSFSQRQVTVSPTSSGKTLIMSAIMQIGLNNFENSCFVWITHNKQLTKQTNEGLHSGIQSYISSVEAIESGS